MKTRSPLLLVPLLALGAGCAVDNMASIEIWGLCGFPKEAATCTTSGECETVIASRPFAFTSALALDGTGPYVYGFDLFVQVNNQLPNNADPVRFRTNTNDFTIEEYRLTFTSSPALPLPPYAFRATHIVPASGSVTPLIPLIPPEIMVLIDAANPTYLYGPGALVEVTVEIFGHLQDGTEILTAPFVVPIDVIDATAGAPTCGGTGSAVAVCPHNGQTATVECS